MSSTGTPNAAAGQANLVEVNAAIHEALEERLLEAIEALTALDLPAAKRLWASLRYDLLAHARTEDRAALPAYAEASPHERGGSPENFEAEHRKLEQLVASCEVTLVELESGGGHRRRRMVLALEQFLQVRRLLEHHTQREQTHLYPRLEQVLAEELRDELAGALNDAFGGS